MIKRFARNSHTIFCSLCDEATISIKKQNCEVEGWWKKYINDLVNLTLPSFLPLTDEQTVLVAERLSDSTEVIQ